MKTILLISPYWKERHRWMVSSLKLAELWQRLGYRVVVACMGERTETVKVSDTLTVHCRKDFFLKDPWNYGIAFGFSRFVRTLVAQERPEIVVVNKVLFWTSLSLFALRLRGIKVLLLSDTLVGMTWWPRGLVPRIGAALYAWTIGWLLLRSASRIVFFHPQPASLLRRLGIAGKTEVIPTGIDPEPYRRGPSAAGVRVAYVGRLESVKGVDDFLAAAVPLLGTCPGLSLQVVGWHAASHPLVERYRHQVQFLGLRDDVPSLLSMTDIFVLPSHSEGLSNALMEAMASGCACIASDVGGNRFLIQNGVSGFLFPAGDREALAAHIRRLIDDASKRGAMGEAARRRIEEHFSWRIVGGLYERLFRSMA